jgi:hypothetical protein
MILGEVFNIWLRFFTGMAYKNEDEVIPVQAGKSARDAGVRGFTD